MFNEIANGQFRLSPKAHVCVNQSSIFQSHEWWPNTGKQRGACLFLTTWRCSAYCTLARSAYWCLPMPWKLFSWTSCFAEATSGIESYNCRQINHVPYGIIF